MLGLEEVFSHVCGQVHRWAPGGELLPFCQRCTGLYVGGAIASTLYLLLRPRPTRPVLWIHGLLLLQMFPFGYHIVPQNGVIRTLTGQLFAFGLVYYLALNPAAQLGVWTKKRKESLLTYGFGALVSVAALQLAVHLGGSETAVALGWIGFAGLLVYIALVLANFAAMPAALGALFRHSQGV